MLTTPRKLMLLLLGLTVALSAVAVACGDDDDNGDAEDTPTASAGTTPGGGSSPAAEIDISGVAELSDGVLLVGSDIAYAPIEFPEEGTNDPIGLDIDLAAAIADVLGVDVEFENGAFDGLLPALDAERYDVIMSAMTASDERKQQVNFVEYFNAGSGIIVAKGNPEGVSSIEDLCGLTVSVQQGTVQVDYLTTQSTACTGAGNDAINVLEFPSNPEAVQALLAGQADAEMADFPVSSYSATQNADDIEAVSGYQVDPAPYGIALRKTSTQLQDVIQQAFDEIVANGTYDQILGEWELQAGAIE